MVWELITTKVALSVTESSSDGNLQSPTWPTGGSTCLPFGAHTPLLAPLLALRACMTSTVTSSSSWTRSFPPFLLSLIESAAAAESPLLSSLGKLKRAPRCTVAHQSSPTALPCSALQSPPSSSPLNPPGSPHFPHSPNWVVETVFFGELNAELLGASLPLWLGSLGCLGS